MPSGAVHPICLDPRGRLAMVKCPTAHPADRHRHRALVQGRRRASANSLGAGARPDREHEPAAFLSTDPKATPAMILGWFVSRWCVETTFQEVRTHLGVETQRQWSDLAILRTTPALLGLFSLITVWADDLARNSGPALRPNIAAWYRKEEPTFSDAIAAVRRVLWCLPGFSMSRKPGETVEIPAELLSQLCQNSLPCRLNCAKSSSGGGFNLNPAVGWLRRSAESGGIRRHGRAQAGFGGSPSG